MANVEVIAMKFKKRLSYVMIALTAILISTIVYAGDPLQDLLDSLTK